MTEKLKIVPKRNITPMGAVIMTYEVWKDLGIIKHPNIDSQLYQDWVADFREEADAKLFILNKELAVANETQTKGEKANG